MELSACRLCREPGASISIFSNQGADSLCTQVMHCAHVSIEPGDGLPEVVCNDCSCQLLASYKFKIQCETSDKYFRTLLTLNSEESVLKQEKEDDHDYPNNDDFDDRISIEDNTLKNEQELDSNYLNIRIRKDSIIEGLTKTLIKLEDQDQINGEKTHLSTPINDSQIKDNKKKKKVLITCKICGKRFKVKHRYIKHVASCNKERRKITIKASSQVELLEWLNIEKNQLKKSNGSTDVDKSLDKQMRRFMCDICGGTYKNLQILVQHQKTHSGTKLYSCNLCKKKFTRNSHVVSHMRIHNNIKPYVCEICGRPFIKSSDLARHRRIHFDARDYSCPLCSRRFKRSTDVTSHLRSHTGDRPYSCACGKSYSSQSSLQKHKKINCSKRHEADLSTKNTSNIKAKTEEQKNNS